MNRRNFLRSAAVATLFPYSAISLVAKEKKEPSQLKIWVERPKFDPNQFINAPKLWIEKDGYKNSIFCNGIDDIIDCHNIDAGWELTYIMLQQLQWDMHRLNKERWKTSPVDGNSTFDEKGDWTKIWLEKNRQCEVTKEEKLKLYLVITLMRKCPNNYPLEPEVALEKVNRLWVGHRKWFKKMEIPYFV